MTLVASKVSVPLRAFSELGVGRMRCAAVGTSPSGAAGERPEEPLALATVGAVTRLLARRAEATSVALRRCASGSPLVGGASGPAERLGGQEAEVDRLALALAAVVAFLDPPLIILGGGVGRNGDLFGLVLRWLCSIRHP